MPLCCARNCSADSEEGNVLISFSRIKTRPSTWKHLISCADQNAKLSDYLYFCDKHFAQDQWIVTTAGVKTLKPFAVPSVFNSEVLEEGETDIHYTLEQQDLNSSGFKTGTVFPCTSISDIVIPGANSEDSGIENEEEMNDDIDKVCKLLHLEITESGVKSFRSRKRKPETDGLELETCKQKVENEMNLLRQELEELRQQSTQLETQFKSLEHNLKRVFHKDQISVILSQPDVSSPHRWSEETLKMALGLRYSLGSSGYSYLVNKNFPLPNVDSMRLYLQSKSPLLSKVFELLEMKVSRMKEEDKNCVLLLDEIKSDTNNEADFKTRVLMTLRSLRGSWQQIVSDSIIKVDKKKYLSKNYITDILKQTEELGLKVHAITLNVGDVLMSKVYGAFKLSCGRSGPVINFFSNPSDPTHRIYVVPHVMNVIQRMNNILMRVGSIRLSSKTVETHKLPSSSVKAVHIKLLTEHIERIEEQLNSSSTSEGKKDTECKISQGLNYLVERENFDVALKTTAWFVELGDKWFEMMTEKERLLALTKKRVEEYEDKIQLLKNVVDIYRSILFGIDSLWRDIQSQVVFASKSVLDIQEIVLEDNINDFFQTSVVTMGRGPLLSGHTIDCNALCLEELLQPISEFDFESCIMAVKDELEASELVELFQ